MQLKNKQTQTPYLLPPSTLPNQSLPLQHLPLKLDQKHRLPRPHLPLLLAPHRMRRNPRREPTTIADALNNPRHVRRAIQLRHLLRHADVRVDQRLIVNDHVLVGRVRVGALLQPVGLSAEEMLPDVDLDEVEEGDDVQGAGLGSRGFADEEEVEELEAYGVALEV